MFLRGWRPASLLLPLAGLLPAAPAAAANFCVSTAAQLSQALIDARFNGQDDTIRLVQGTYVGNFQHIADLDDLRVEGGWNAGCASRSLDPANTVLDGNASGRALNLFSVNPVGFSVDGVTVRNGRAPGGASVNGGGLQIVAGNVTAGGTVAVTNCIIRDNAAFQDGGGLYIYRGGNVSVSGSVLQNNSAGYGAGLYSSDNTSITFTGNLVSGNSAFYPPNGSGGGAGMYVDMTFPNRLGSGNTTLTVTDNVFTGNQVLTGSGGAFFVCGVANGGATSCSAVTGWVSTVSFSRNSISANQAMTGAGGGVVNGNDVRFDANTWSGNGATFGGGVACSDVDSLVLTNNLFHGNLGSGNAGGLFAFDVDSVTLTNNTFTGNDAPLGGGALVQLKDDADSARLYNNVLYGNTGANARNLYVENNGDGSGGFSPVTIQSNDLDTSAGGFIISQPGYVPGPGNINANPLFVNPAGADYHLQAASPCRDAGDNAAPALPATDHDSLPRVVGGTVDMGAFEYQSADLAVTKTDGQASAVPGLPVSYTIVVTNAGPSPVPSATVTDTPPGILTGVTWTCVAAGGSSCPASGSGAINHTASAAVGGTLTYTLTGTLSPSATGTLVNTASVATPAGIPDTNAANNSATDTDTLTPQADLQAAKSDGQASAVPGLPLTYQMTVSNAGPSSASGAMVTDTLPGALGGASWTCTASAGSSCPASGSGSIGHAVNLAFGGTLSYSLTALLSPSATGSLSNTLSVAAPGGVTDPAAGNNSATDTDSLTPVADLRVTKSDGQTAAIPGGTVNYSIVGSNLGPSDATGATLADAFPAAVTGVTWSCTPSGGASCGGGGGTGNINRVVDLPVGGAVGFAASATVSAAASGTLANTATIAAPGGVSDPDPSNDSATDVDVLTLTGLSELVHGSLQVRSLESTGPGAPANLYWIRQAPRSSYEVVVDAVTGDVASPGGSGPNLDLLAADASTVVQGSGTAGSGPSRSLKIVNDSSHAREDQFVRVQSAGCTASCGPQDTYRIRAWETTCRAPRFNNSASQVTVLLVKNRTDKSVSGTAWFWGPTGALLASQPFSVPARGLFSLNTASVVPGASGSLSLSHDGPYGGLDGKAVAIEPATGFSFDTALLPRAR